MKFHENLHEKQWFWLKFGEIFAKNWNDNFLNFWFQSGAKECKSCRNIWFSLFFLFCGSQKGQDHKPTRKSRFLIGKSTIWEICQQDFSGLIKTPDKNAHNRPEMAREDTEGWPKVDRTLTQRWPKVDPTSTPFLSLVATEPPGRPSTSSRVVTPYYN